MRKTDSFIQIAKALSDPQRVAILERIAKEPEVPCKALVDEFHISPATISHHVKELVEAGLIEYRKCGKCAYFSTTPDVMAGFQSTLKKRFGKPRAAVKKTVKKSA